MEAEAGEVLTAVFYALRIQLVISRLTSPTMIRLTEAMLRLTAVSTDGAGRYTALPFQLILLKALSTEGIFLVLDTAAVHLSAAEGVTAVRHTGEAVLMIALQTEFTEDHTAWLLDGAAVSGETVPLCQGYTVTISLLIAQETGSAVVALLFTLAVQLPTSTTGAFRGIWLEEQIHQEGLILKSKLSNSKIQERGLIQREGAIGE